MNYKLKYLKYKDKYINLKKQLGGSNLNTLPIDMDINIGNFLSLDDLNSYLITNKHFNTLRKSEQRLHAIIKVIDKFVDILDVFGDTTDKSVLDWDDLTKMTNKRDGLIDRNKLKQDNILNIIKSIIENQ